jgi:hypothetical protein
MKLNKTAVATLVAGIAVGSTGVGLAAPHLTALLLKQDQAVSYANVHCVAVNPATTIAAQLVCTRNDGKGLGVVINARYVVVAKIKFDKDGKVLSKKVYLNRANK